MHYVKKTVLGDLSFVIWHIVLLEASIRTHAPVSPQCLYGCVFSALSAHVFPMRALPQLFVCFVVVFVGGGGVHFVLVLHLEYLLHHRIEAALGHSHEVFQ